MIEYKFRAETIQNATVFLIKLGEEFGMSDVTTDNLVDDALGDIVEVTFTTLCNIGPLRRIARGASKMIEDTLDFDGEFKQLIGKREPVRQSLSPEPKNWDLIIDPYNVRHLEPGGWYCLRPGCGYGDSFEDIDWTFQGMSLQQAADLYKPRLNSVLENARAMDESSFTMDGLADYELCNWLTIQVCREIDKVFPVNKWRFSRGYGARFGFEIMMKNHDKLNHEFHAVIAHRFLHGGRRHLDEMVRRILYDVIDYKLELKDSVVN
jgi:hypothetical protein